VAQRRDAARAAGFADCLDCLTKPLDVEPPREAVRRQWPS
jgi:hypothetical protein